MLAAQTPGISYKKDAANTTTVQTDIHPLHMCASIIAYIVQVI